MRRFAEFAIFLFLEQSSAIPNSMLYEKWITCKKNKKSLVVLETIQDFLKLEDCPIEIERRWGLSQNSLLFESLYFFSHYPARFWYDFWNCVFLLTSYVWWWYESWDGETSNRHFSIFHASFIIIIIAVLIFVVYFCKLWLNLKNV